MGKRLYVGNLSYSLKNEELQEVFSKIGEVTSVKIITDMETGRSKGFAFVEMATDDMGVAAIETLNGKDVGGRALKVTEANPRPERPAGGNRFGGNREGGFRGNREREGGFDRNRDSGFDRNRDSGFDRNRDSGFDRNRDSGFGGNRDSGFGGNFGGSDMGFGGGADMEIPTGGGRGGRDGGFRGGKRKDRNYDEE